MKHLLTAIACCLAVAGSAQSDCPEPLDSNSDGLIGVEDLMNLLSRYGDSDVDNDGIFDSVDDCVGTYDVCGICNGPGLIDGFTSCDEIYGPCSANETLNFHGYDYDLVSIAGNCWFQENLRSYIFNNGDSIPLLQDQQDWTDTTEPAAAMLNNAIGNYTDFGLIYNGYVVGDGRNVCPVGWHISTEEDWQSLELSIGMTEADLTNGGWGGWRGEADSLGFKIKSDTDWNGTNETGFNGLNGYCRDPNGWFFFSAGYYAEGGVWWAAEDGVNGGFNRYVHTEEAGIYRSPFADANWGYYIRCVKD